MFFWLTFSFLVSVALHSGKPDRLKPVLLEALVPLWLESDGQKGLVGEKIANTIILGGKFQCPMLPKKI
jgi:hypothetical protein